MSFNVKKKVMLALLAGGMLCANGAFAESASWYGTAGGFVTSSSAAAKTGVNLVITDSTIVEGNYVSFPNKIYGGYDHDGSGSVTGNSITFNTTLTIRDAAVIYGGAADDNPVTGNEVKIRNGIFGMNVLLHGGLSLNGNANENIVEVSGGTFMADSQIYGGFSNSGDANNNKVYFEGCTFSAGNVILFGGCSWGGTANGNEIYILGDTEFISSLSVLAGVGITAARGNNVYIGNEDATTVFNNLKFQQLYGGLLAPNPDLDITGNVLHVRTAHCSVTDVGAFDTFNFTLPASIQNNDKILTVTDELVVDYAGGTATINVKAANGVKLKAGDVITLIESDATYDTFIGGDVLGGAGEVSMTDGSVGDARNIILTLLKDFEQKQSAGSEDQQKAPIEGIAATVAMLNQSADLAMGEGLASLLENTNGNNNKNVSATAENGTISNINTYAAFNGNRSKYKTGSHIDMDGWGFLVGAGNTKNWNNGQKTTYGLFFEYGKGDFDTYNNAIHGEGDSNNKGVGIIGRHTLNNNTYFDGAIRYGKQETEWSESEIGNYETDSKYFGAALGIGHIYSIGKNELDIYGRYTYGHTGSCDATVGENQYKFDSVNSSRLRVGTKLNIIVKGKKVKPYVGVAWEREMKGESRATITGMGEAPAPSLKGNTGIMQAGCSWEAGKWTLGAEANAYIGKRKGWGGMFNAFYNF